MEKTVAAISLALLIHAPWIAQDYSRYSPEGMPRELAETVTSAPAVIMPVRDGARLHPWRAIA